jgi:hypothetical protein
MKYYSLNNSPILPNEIGQQQGVYILYALNSDLSPQPINRVLGIDTNGVLYIGQTTQQDFKTRISKFKSVMNPNLAAKKHSGALNFKEIQKLRERFPISALYVSIIPSSKPKQEESRLIEEYRQIFGEVPPLNGSK